MSPDKSPGLHGLYVIIDPDVSIHRDLAWLTSEVIAGGAKLIQWRDKTREKGLQLPDVEVVLAVCLDRGVPMLVNDHADLALAAGADGVHVGQKDLPVAVVRRLFPPEWIVGTSTNNVAEARQALADGASYVAVGNLFGSTSKSDTRPASLEMLHAVRAAVSVPVCGIGGVRASNIRSVVDTGAQMACAISAVVAANDPRAAARELSNAFET